jgi:hypothetical protein
MQITLRRLTWVAGLLLVAALTPDAHAQRRLLYDPPPAADPPAQAAPAVRVTLNVTNPAAGLSVRTTVTVPDNGTVLAGGYRRLSESRSEYGSPVLGKVPSVNRGARNVGYGRTLSSGKVTVRARVIDLREEEFRQTGFRSP